jgi:RecA/RadA recombinase
MKHVLAEPVSLGCDALDRLTASGRGLRAGEAVLVTGAPSSGKTELAYLVAARHIARDGVVAWVACPGAAGLCCRRFAAVLEAHLLSAGMPQRPATFHDAVAAAGGVERLQERILRLLGRVQVTVCGSPAALASALTQADLFSRLGAAEQDGGKGRGAARLLVLDGLGAACDTATLERLVGQEAPVLQLMAEAVARHRCALVATDMLPPSAVHHLPSLSRGGFSSSGTSSFCAAPEVVLDASHTFRHVRGCIASTRPRLATAPEGLGDGRRRAALAADLFRLACVLLPGGQSSERTCYVLGLSPTGPVAGVGAGLRSVATGRRLAVEPLGFAAFAVTHDGILFC